jgi:hypothetical protein
MNEPSSYSTRHSSPPHIDASGVIDGPWEEQLDSSEVTGIEPEPEGGLDAGTMTDPGGGLLETAGVGVAVSEIVT